MKILIFLVQMPFLRQMFRFWGQRLKTEMYYVYDDYNCEQKIQRQFSQLISSQIHKFINPNIYLSQRNYVIVSPNLI